MTGSSSSSNRAKKVWSLTAILIVTVAIVVAAILIGNMLFQNREQRITSTDTQAVSGVLDCTAKDPTDAFFVTDGPREHEHEIKVTYRNVDADKFYYTYEAEFDNFNAAEDAESKLHADYNIYMGAYMDDFSNNFTTIEDEAKAEVFAEAKDLGSYTARIFLMSPEEYEQFDGNYDIEQLQKFYEGKGFQCELDD